jgi:uncharacterized protein YqjF (DUF2071 family)
MILSAPVGAMQGRRRPRRPWHVLVTLEDLLIVTWEVPEDALRRLMPSPLLPWTRQGWGRLSAVLFRNRRLRPALPGMPRLNCFQMNLRTYVLDPATGRPGAVFFHRLLLSKRWLSVFSSAVFRVPFGYLPLQLSVSRDGDATVWEGSSEDGSVSIVAEEETRTNAPAPDAEMLDLLTNPHTGFVPDSRGNLVTWSLWHRNQSPRLMRVERCRIVALESLGLLGGPVSALLVDRIDYEVYLPAANFAP